MDIEFELEWPKVKTKNWQRILLLIDLSCFAVPTFPNSVNRFFLFFFGLVTCLIKTWFKLWRVELCINDLKRNKNYWELLRVRVAEGKTTVKAWRKSSGNWLWFKLVKVQVIRSRLKLFQGYMLSVQGEVKRASLAAFVVSLQRPHLLQI